MKQTFIVENEYNNGLRRFCKNINGGLIKFDSLEKAKDFTPGNVNRIQRVYTFPERKLVSERLVSFDK